MLTTRWQPLGMAWPEMKRLQKEMEQWARRAGMNDPRRSVQSVYPPLNLWEDDNNLYVEAELPELELTDLEIFVDGDNQLSIKGEASNPSGKTARGTARSEAMAASRGWVSCPSTWTATRSRRNSSTVC